MRKTLQERLRNAQIELSQITSVLGSKSREIPQEVDASFRDLIGFGSEINYWLNLIEARSVALQFLNGLETRVNEHEQVLYGESNINFQHMRLLGVIAYLTTKWSLADSITGKIARVLCIKEYSSNKTKPANLATHFVAKEQKRKNALAIFDSVRDSFGWPIVISYVIRNHFIHDGGQFYGLNFFEGPTAASGFRIAKDAWDNIEKTAKDDYDVNSSLHRLGANWPINPCDDLRIVLSVCEGEMDDALGVLIGSACGLMKTHVGFMLGED